MTNGANYKRGKLHHSPWHSDIRTPNQLNSEDDCAADDESDLEHNNGIEDLECPEQQDVSAAPNVLGLVRPTRKSKRQAD